MKKKLIKITDENQEGYKKLRELLVKKVYTFTDTEAILLGGAIIIAYFINKTYMFVLFATGACFPIALPFLFTKPLKINTKELKEKYPYLDTNIDIMSLDKCIEKYDKSLINLLVEKTENNKLVEKVEELKEDLFNDRQYKYSTLNRFNPMDNETKEKTKVKVRQYLKNRGVL